MSAAALAGWLAVFAGYAVVDGIVSPYPARAWAVWAAVSYALAALAALAPLAAWRWRGSAAPFLTRLPFLIGVGGAVLAPTLYLEVRGQPDGEPDVVARGAALLLRYGSPYLRPGQLLSAQSYNPYLPAISVFGFPRAAGLPGVLGSPASWLAAATAVLVAVAIGVGLPPPAPGEPTQPSNTGVARKTTVARNTALALLSPVLALPVALGTTDPPLIALLCVALACAGRPADGPAPWAARRRWPRGQPPRWLTWRLLTALAVGAACAMKATAWPVLPVIAAMIAVRDGPRAAARFTGAAVAVAAVLVAVLAPALLHQPGALFDNIVAYPLGLAHHMTTAASPLPGHLLADTGSAGRVAAIGLLLASAAGIAASLVLRPPRDVRAATLRLALGLALLFTLAPATRFGYYAYPAALLGWLALTGRGHAYEGKKISNSALVPVRLSFRRAIVVPSAPTCWVLLRNHAKDGGG